MKAREINDTIRYTMWSVFKRTSALDDPPIETADAALRAIDRATRSDDLVVRGWYDIGGLRADADLMVWWHAPDSDTLQHAYHALRRSDLGVHLVPVWSQLALHRPAEFNKGHVPAFMSGEDPKAYLSVYPFVRSYEWYLLPDEERGQMLRDHGMLGRDFPQVISNTVSSFALGDWEWILGLEAPELVDLVDLMRHLRSTEARNHVREEIPFYTGRRITAGEIAEVLA